MYQILLDLRQNPMVKSCFAFGDTVHVTFRKGEKEKGEKEKEVTSDELQVTSDKEDLSLVTRHSSLKNGLIKNYLTERGHKNIVVKEIEPNIEDCYMKLSQNGSD
jgi:hypothetical protein